MYTIENIKKEISNILKVDSVNLNIPPTHIDADLVMNFSPEENKKFSDMIKESESDLIASAEASGPFLNIKLNKNKVFGEVVENVINRSKDFGRLNLGSGKTVIIEYSSPNIAKPIGVGHLRGTVLGESLARLHEFADYDVIRENFLGDWGTQFGKLVLAYKKWGDDKKIKEDPLFELKELYVKFQKEAEKNDELNEEARDIFRRLENGDKEIKDLWKEFKKISINEFKRTYKMLDISFGVFSGESMFIDDANDLIDDSLEKNISEKKNSGEVVVEDDSLPSFLLRKQDGSTLYITRDLAALKKRMEAKPNKIMYVVGNEQSLHFKQLFHLAEKMGICEKSNVEHIPFGLLMVDGKKMSTRRGTLVELDDLIKESIKRSKDLIMQKNKDVTEDEISRISMKTGIGAVIYSILRQSRSKNLEFNWDKALSVEGESVAYLQYTCVRISSILKKVYNTEHKDDDIPYKAEDMMFETGEEFTLVKHLMFFPNIIENSLIAREPQKIANYLEELASDFNAFYNKVSILNTEDPKLKWSRVNLIKAVKITLDNGLRLLNIKVPEKM